MDRKLALPIGIILIIAIGFFLTQRQTTQPTTPPDAESKTELPDSLEMTPSTSPKTTTVPEDERRQLLTQARDALQAGRFDELERLADQLLAINPKLDIALIFAGKAATAKGQLDTAVNFFLQAGESGGPPAAFAFSDAAHLQFLELNQISAGEATVRRALAHDLNHSMANNLLSRILVVTGRRWEAVPYLFLIAKQGNADLSQLLWLSILSNNVDDPRFVQPESDLAEDEMVKLGQARAFAIGNRFTEAIHLSRQVLESNPEEIEAHALLCAALLHTEKDPEFLRAVHEIPEDGKQHPDIWVSWGRFAEKQSQPRVAARCYWEALRLDPNHETANYRISQVLTSVGLSAKARAFAEHAKKLIALRENIFRIDVFERDPNAQVDLEDIKSVISLMESLGRIWEAGAWANIAAQRGADTEWANKLMTRIRQRVTDQTPLTIKAATPMHGFGLTRFPLPDWEIPREAATTQNAPTKIPEIRLTDVTAASGVHFDYFDSRENAQDIAGIFVTTGGGIGVLDFDCDGWPDFYFPQGSEFPFDVTQRKYLDKVFRNLGNGEFLEVTNELGIAETQYSQGVSIGDFNNDGFPDIYIANIGTNRLYRNNGDGTFHDASEVAGLSQDSWTTSCMLADINGDGLPDLFDVNYLAGDEIFTKTCGVSEASMHICGPRQYAADGDHLLISHGDGSFTNVTESSGIDTARGKGLGVLTHRFPTKSSSHLYVANDSVDNFHYSAALKRDEPLTFREDGLLRGVAVNNDGFANGSMGVAFGDIDNDGLLDLFVTNFVREANALYRQTSPGQFDDVTRSFGLYDAGFSLSGFGTQFLDVDLDGRRDLFVSNGHIDPGLPNYAMPPQLFYNGSAGFDLVENSQLGNFFQRDHVGRAVARVDWNRDGREELVITHLAESATLLLNQTPITGNYIKVQLRGVSSSRDAIGATVRVYQGTRQFVQQISAGDGYQCSNQRVLLFGIGAAQTIDKVEILWPSGKQQSWHDLTPNSLITAIEGVPELHTETPISLSD